SAVLFEEIDRGYDTATGAADARLRSARLDALDALVSDLEHVTDLEVLDRARFGSQAQHRVLRLGMKDEAGGIGFGVTADDQNFLPEVDESCERVLGGCRFADASLAVKCDLSQSGHGLPFRLASSCVGRKSPPQQSYVEQLA